MRIDEPPAPERGTGEVLVFIGGAGSAIPTCTPLAETDGLQVFR
jgi:hypothetical protein